MKAICTRWQWIESSRWLRWLSPDVLEIPWARHLMSEGEDGGGASWRGSGEEGGTKPGGGAPVIETESDTSSSSTEQDSTGVESDTEEEDAGTPGPFRVSLATYDETKTA